ncbi:tryptophan synthase subunit alpha [Pseudokordiimonas caeni]|uniref:tryptophan synthase subunit alpha n=1 Tax=Pseudokordiimonas caeni TaxID=2997908 RepID=UPI0028120219|nr:tryptophan synthase subunit alpha [Pseudokordiimonas caeni]
MTRLTDRFAALKAENRAALIPFIVAGDPDHATTFDILKGLPEAGADIIELGMPFSDPSADGPAIEKAAGRALKAGASMVRTLDLVRDFRKGDTTTPIVLMGYFNPIMAYGIDAFVKDAVNAGADGLIIVDLPPEEDAELREPATAAGLSVIRLATPTSTDARLATILDGASGFVYYVSVAGVTGQKSAASTDIAAAVARIRAQSDLPVAVGFGIRTPEQAAEVATHADAAVVGSAIVSRIEAGLDENGKPADGLVREVLGFVSGLKAGVARGRKP